MPIPYQNLFVNQLQSSCDLKKAIKIHTQILKSGFSDDTLTTNHLINAYLRSQRTEDAQQLFDEMPHSNVVSWTSLMAGYIDSGRPDRSLKLFEKMPKSKIVPNDFTFATAINACSTLSDIKTGQKVHAQVEILGFRSNLVVSTALVNMYGKCNKVEEARILFDKMTQRNVVSWTSMISVYAQNAHGHEALGLFGEFLREPCSTASPNHFTFSSVLNACASLGRLVAGKSTHVAVIRRGYDTNEVVATALIDMYSKCGCIEYSNRAFRLVTNPSVIPYTSMIVGAAKYGLGTVSLELFEEMLEKGIRPNGVTFVGVLYACSHSGLVDIGLKHFDSMCSTYKITPDVKHYTCAVDMLGRAGHLHKAYELSKSITMDDDDDAALLWATLLSASRIHNKLELAVEAGKRLIELNRQVAATYVTVSNAHASFGNWDDVRRIRSEMKRRGIRKEPGCSWVEIKNVTYVFYAGDMAQCARGNEVAELLRELEVKMKERGYVGGSNGLVFVDVEVEAKESIVGLHSERLALAFGLLSIPKGVTIRVMKNLRICGDCHEAFKLISEIVGRDFVMRDVNRFHHFRDGSCTCGDYW